MPAVEVYLLEFQLEEDTLVLVTNLSTLLVATEAVSWKVQNPSFSIGHHKTQVNSRG